MVAKLVLYALNLYSVVCQLYFNKTGRQKQKTIKHDSLPKEKNEHVGRLERANSLS